MTLLIGTLLRENRSVSSSRATIDDFERENRSVPSLACPRRMSGSRRSRPSCSTSTGSPSTGVDALSKAAGISKRTLYERFGSKDGLIVAAYDSLDLPVFELLTGPAEAASERPARAARRALRPARGDGEPAAVPRLPVRERVLRAGRLEPSRARDRARGTRSGCAAGSSAARATPARRIPTSSRGS